MRGRPPKESPRPPQHDAWQFRSRDSDASSFCSSRLSSSSIGFTAGGGGGINRGSAIGVAASVTDPAFKQSAIRIVNAYLFSHNIPLSLSLRPLSSAKDITDTLRFVLSRLEFTTSKLDEDLPLVLKHLNCPYKLSKSALKAASTPHGFPQLLAVISWLVQIAEYNDHLVVQDSTTGGYSSLQDDAMMGYVLSCYVHFLQREDERVKALDGELVQRMEHEKECLSHSSELLENEIKELEKKLEDYKSGLSPMETLENEKKLLEEDVNKFEHFIADLTDGIATMQKALEEKEKELSAKLEENKLKWEENEELRRRIEIQGISSREAERMKKEMQGLEKEIVEADAACNAWEEKCWDLDSLIVQKLKELEALSMDCNEALRKLKLKHGGNFQFALNAKGSSPAEVIGIDYKSTLRPKLESFTSEIKENSKSKWEELVALQKQATEMTSKIQAKRNRFMSLQSDIDEAENQLNFIKKEIQESSSRCAAEARRMMEDVEMETHKIDRMEREALETSKVEELKLQETIKQSDEDAKKCAQELLILIDSVSKYKEQTESQILEMKKDLIGAAAEFISDAYKSLMSVQFVKVNTSLLSELDGSQKEVGCQNP
ncbi:hypothetical protein Dimus_004751 [Dionaea muscipula]